MLNRSAAVSLIRDELMPAFLAERERLERIDRWYRWDPDKPHKPKQATKEYQELAERSQTGWLGLVVTDVAQNLYVEGYRSSPKGENARPWDYWQKNGLDKRQIAIHRAALAYGLSYMTVLPGETQQGEAIPVMRGISPRRMIAFYADVAEDDGPRMALRADPAKVDGSMGWALRLYDDEEVYYLNADSSGTSLTWIESRSHGVGFCPIVRFANILDLEGRADGEVEPFIPLAGRINQTTFDRLVIQRFAAWVVRTIAGMTKPATQEEADAEKLRLKVEDILVGEDPNTKFGSLPASDLSGLIAAKDSDVRDFSAVTQTPPHHLMGQMANLSAEALAAADASLMRKVTERKHSFGDSHEQGFRAGSHIMGDAEAASDFSSQARWADTETRSLAQVADALGKLAQTLGLPIDMLWEKIPGWTDQDVERAKDLIVERMGPDGLTTLMQQAMSQAPPAPTPAPVLNGS